MKCPKCGYIGFEPSDRCRNCGYEFSLVRQPAVEEDLSIRSDASGAPLADFDLGEARRPAPRTPPGQRRLPDPSLDPELARGAPPADLPLFGDEPADGVPPIVFSAGPTPPLAVRRATPVVRRERLRTTPRPPEPARLRFGADPDEGGESARPAPTAAAADAPAGTRLSAALLDWLMLAAIDLVVVYFTLRVCRLPAGDVGRLPIVPLGLFLLLLNGGYLALLTGAGGQTIGKMAFDLKVVGRAGETVSMTMALLRTLALLLSALPAGLGLVSILFDRDRRGLHDRLSRTRVIGVDS